MTSGVSAVIMPDGRITQRTGMFVADSLVPEGAAALLRDPATRLGVLPEMLLVAVAVGGLGWAGTTVVRGAGTAPFRAILA